MIRPGIDKICLLSVLHCETTWNPIYVVGKLVWSWVYTVKYYNVYVLLIRWVFWCFTFPKHKKIILYSWRRVKYIKNGNTCLTFYAHLILWNNLPTSIVLEVRKLTLTLIQSCHYPLKFFTSLHQPGGAGLSGSGNFI